MELDMNTLLSIVDAVMGLLKKLMELGLLDDLL